MTSHRNCLMTRRGALRVGVGAFGLTLPGLLQAQAAAGRRPAKSPRAKSVIVFNKDGGRDHWPGCYSLVLAGGGIAGGLVYGASDSTSSTPVRDPVSPNDLMATVYHVLGVDHHAVMYDMQDRPHVILEGDPVRGLLA